MKTDAARFQNALRIMFSLDEIYQVLPPEKVAAFHRDPIGVAIRMDAPTWAKVFALIEARQSDLPAPPAIPLTRML